LISGIFSATDSIAYEYPIGIPSAWISPDVPSPNQPNGWPFNVVSGYYYIDNSVPCTDSDNTYGCPANPRCSFPSTFSAGDYVEIHGGPFTGSTFYVTVNGTASNPVWFRGTPEQPVEMQRDFVVKGTHAFFENLKFTGDHKLAIRPHGNIQTDHIIVRNSEVRGTGQAVGSHSAFSADGTNGLVTSDIIFYNNIVSYCGDSETTVENDFHGFTTGSYVHNIWILNNETHNNGGDGVQLSHAGVDAHHIYIGRNHFYHEGENAIDVKKANDVIISQNIAHDFEKRNSSSGVAIVIHYEPDSIWVLYNEVYDTEWAIQSTGSTNTWFIGNVIHNVHHTGSWDPNSGYSSGAALHFRGGSSGGAIYNTIYNYDTGLQLTQGSTSYTVENNIFADRAEPTGYDIRVADSSIANVTTLARNLMFTSGTSRTSWAGTTYDVSGLQGIAQCSGCLEENPLFVDRNNNDFHLTSSSAAIGAGSASAALSNFQSRYGISIAKDADGLLRPQDTWDMGVFEYDEGYEPPPSLNPPSGVKVILQ
jgi:hypothetical protein